MEQAELVDFFEAMGRNGRQVQAEDIERLLSCIKAMQEEFSDAMDEISYLREQIQLMEDATVKARFQKIQAEMQEGLKQAGEQVMAVKREAAEAISHAMSAFKVKGIRAFDKVLDAVHIQEGLCAAEIWLHQSAAAMEQGMERADHMPEEVHAVKGHVKNVGKIALGKPLEELTPRDKSKGVMAKIKKSMEYCRNLMEALSRKLLMARAHVEHLHQLAQKENGEKIPAVQEIARELKEASAMEFPVQPELKDIR